ncbi:MAG: hypothetical protein ABUS79_20915 [Pseudomonadota bacterium]
MRLLVCTLVALAWVGSARAASLSVDAPEGCLDPATLNQEIADLIGRPLADSPDADFRLTIAPGRAGRWHLRLEASHSQAGGPDAPRARELDAATCAELADAAAVAIAVSVRALAGAAEPAPRAPSVPPAAGPLPAAAAIEVAPAPPRPRWRPGLTLALAADSGELPHTGLGVMGGAEMGRRWFRLALTIGWFPARDAAVPEGGGQFQLVFAAVDACVVAPAWRGWTVLACAGGELGAYGATGQSVARPNAQTTLWRAGRGRLGTSLALTDSVAFAVNATAVMPLAQPTFVLDDGEFHVYRPDAVGVRIDAGLEVVF